MHLHMAALHATATCWHPELSVLSYTPYAINWPKLTVGIQNAKRSIIQKLTIGTQNWNAYGRNWQLESKMQNAVRYEKWHLECKIQWIENWNLNAKIEKYKKIRNWKLYSNLSFMKLQLLLVRHVNCHYLKYDFF